MANHGILDALEQDPLARHLIVCYSLQAAVEPSFLDSAQHAEQENVVVSIAALDARQSRRLFGVPLARRRIQPVWLRIENRGSPRRRLHLVSIDPKLLLPREAAAANHYSVGNRLMALGLIGYLVFLPVLLLVPLKIISGLPTATLAGRALFCEQAFPLRAIAPGKASEGFVFTSRDVGTKVVHLRLLRVEGPIEFDFNLPVSGIDADYERRELAVPGAPDQTVDCDLPALFQRLEALPRAVTGSSGLKEGDPASNT